MRIWGRGGFILSSGEDSDKQTSYRANSTSPTTNPAILIGEITSSALGAMKRKRNLKNLRKRAGSSLLYVAFPGIFTSDLIPTHKDSEARIYISFDNGPM